MQHMFLLYLKYYKGGEEWVWASYNGAKVPKLKAWSGVTHAILVTSGGKPVGRYYVKDKELNSNAVNKSVLTKIINKTPYHKNHEHWVPMFIGPPRR